MGINEMHLAKNTSARRSELEILAATSTPGKLAKKRDKMENQLIASALPILFRVLFTQCPSALSKTSNGQILEGGFHPWHS